MKYIRLIRTDDINFQQAWELYKCAFPQEERRELILQNKIIKNPSYHFVIVKEEGLFLGFILWWRFEGLRYIEHIATMENHRGKGYGQRIIKQFISESPDPIILEVEPAFDDISIRRIAFYERIGFNLNHHYYEQYPMRKNSASIKMLLMSYPKCISASEFFSFKKCFKEMCYTPYFR